MITDVSELLPLINQAFQAGKTVSLPVNGSSMHPFLEGGRDSVELKKPDCSPAVGDVVVFRRGDGYCVLHRVVAVCGNDSFFTAGDNRIEVEGPIVPEQLVATAISAVRKGKIIKSDSELWRFFSCHMTRRSRLRSLLGKLKK